MSKKDLSDDLEQLLGTGLFANVDANVTPSKDGYAVEFVFREKIWPQVQTLRVSGSSVLPCQVELEVLDAARNSQNYRKSTCSSEKYRGGLLYEQRFDFWNDFAL